jgi:hypothetical protein
VDVLVIALVAIVVGWGAFGLASDQAEWHEVALIGALALIIGNFLITGVLVVAEPDHGDLLLPMLGVLTGSSGIAGAIAMGVAVAVGGIIGDAAKKK